MLVHAGLQETFFIKAIKALKEESYEMRKWMLTHKSLYVVGRVQKKGLCGFLDDPQLKANLIALCL